MFTALYNRLNRKDVWHTWAEDLEIALVPALIIHISIGIMDEAPDTILKDTYFKDFQ